MKRLLEFLKTTLLGGLFVLLPVLLLYLLLAEMVGLVVALATPIVELFPQGTFDRVYAPGVVAALLIVAASFLTGLAARSSVGRRVGLWIEGAILAKLPLYVTLKKLTRTIADARQAESFRPALLHHEDGSAEPAYLIEEHEEGRATVLLPWSPAALAGSIRLVPRERVGLLDTDLGEFTKVLGQWGVGTKAMLRRGTI